MERICPEKTVRVRFFLPYAAENISACTEVTLESYTFSADATDADPNEMKFFCVRIAGTWFLWYPDGSEG